MLRVRDLSIRRGGRILVKRVSLQLAAGGVLAVLGPNGAGKSSLLLALAGLLPAQGGSIELAGRPLPATSRRAIAALIAWQGELPPTDFGLTVEQRLRLANAEAEGMAAALAQLDLDGMQGRTLAELSAGERQRVELAAVMLRDCPIWLLDEPTAHLDLKHQAAWLAIMRREAGRGRAIAVVLHDINQAASVATKALLVYGDGRASYGGSGALLAPDSLARLYGVPLVCLRDTAGRSVLIPDVAGGDDEKA